MILADSIDGGILALLFLGAGLVASVLALGGLFPASKGNKLLTFCLITPALIVGVSVTIWLGVGYVKENLHDPDFEFGHDLLMPWIFLAGPAFAASLLGMLVLWVKRRNMK